MLDFRFWVNGINSKSLKLHDWCWVRFHCEVFVQRLVRKPFLFSFYIKYHHEAFAANTFWLINLSTFIRKPNFIARVINHKTSFEDIHSSVSLWLARMANQLESHIEFCLHLWLWRATKVSTQISSGHLLSRILYLKSATLVFLDFPTEIYIIPLVFCHLP